MNSWDRLVALIKAKSGDEVVGPAEVSRALKIPVGTVSGWPKKGLPTRDRERTGLLQKLSKHLERTVSAEELFPGDSANPANPAPVVSPQLSPVVYLPGTTVQSRPAGNRTGIRMHSGAFVEVGDETSAAMDPQTMAEFMKGLGALGFRFEQTAAATSRGSPPGKHKRRERRTG